MGTLPMCYEYFFWIFTKSLLLSMHISTVSILQNLFLDKLFFLNFYQFRPYQYMQHAEKKCNKIKSGRIPFSLESSLWIFWANFINRTSNTMTGEIEIKATSIDWQGDVISHMPLLS